MVEDLTPGGPDFPGAGRPRQRRYSDWSDPLFHLAI
jgi:hypothetical protein